ncbi:EAL domain-containing protein [Aquamicrobium ahrensii]|uniref:EAL domain-containing protein (Putative c-di-GMP-specific phosphodiesterase class I) n=1 Tax=Aquamicrobium ahrensii TaxID=469551 RepID=A0ABV2KIR8_9HYPH
MTTGGKKRRLVTDAIFADEIGVEYAIHDEFRLRSAYQPIFTPRGDLLRMVAVEAVVEAHRKGGSVCPAVFLDTIDPDERSYIGALCRTLHVRNFRNLGLRNASLFFGFDSDIDTRDGAISELRQMSGRLEELDLHPGLVMCQIDVRHGDDAAPPGEMVREMRASGLGVVLTGFGVAEGGEALLNLVRPDVVRVDGPLFALLCSYPAAGRLFGRLVTMLKTGGTQVLVEGIATPRQLQVAVEAGADLLQGVLLSKPLPAGAFFDQGPLVTGALLPRTGSGI